MSTEPITQALERLELAGAYHRAARSRQIGVPQIELTALEHLAASGGLTPGELGHRLGLTSGGVTALTGRLIDAGCVTRDHHPDDGRMRVLALSEAGAERLRDHMAPVRDPLEDAAAATPGPEPAYPSDGYTRALLM
jgi:DNA-binding MarR family transcriptional regulator